MTSAADSTVFGLPTKYVALLTLVVQNSSLVLTMRYSRILPGPQYLTSTAVVLSELLKCIICISVHLHNSYSASKQESQGRPLLSDGVEDVPSTSTYNLHQFVQETFSVKSGFPKLLVPAVLYTLQNNLQFVAASNLDAATFQVTYQGKILTTALFAVLLLRQQLSAKKWLSLLILTMGVAAVQIPSGGQSQPTQQGSYTAGISAVFVACLLSGLAGVYFEMVLKGSSTSIWIRNIQLSVGCLVIALCGALIWDGPAIHDKGFFQGYSLVTIVTVCMQAGGGLIVAMVIKYADNILKGFATSMSVILSTVASVFLFDFVVTRYFVVGAALVFLSTYLYGQPDAQRVIIAETDVEKTAALTVEEFNEKSGLDEQSIDCDQNVERYLDSNSRTPTRNGIIYEELGHVA